jgi:hypothetical protein
MDSSHSQSYIEDVDMFRDDSSDSGLSDLSSISDSESEKWEDIPPPIFKNPSPMKKSVFVDIQFLKGCRNSLVCKELGYVSSDGRVYGSIIFDRPYPDQCLGWEQRRTNRWLANNYHGLSWNLTGIPYDLLRSIIRQKLAFIQKEGYDTIYMKGEMKIRWLYHRCADSAALRQVLIPSGLTIKNLDDYDIPRLSKLRADYSDFYLAMQCNTHKDCFHSSDRDTPYVCAYAHAHLLKKFCIEKL